MVTGSVADEKQSTQHEYSDEVMIVGMETSKHERVGGFCSHRLPLVSASCMCSACCSRLACDSGCPSTSNS